MSFQRESDFKCLQLKWHCQATGVIFTTFYNWINTYIYTSNYTRNVCNMVDSGYKNCYNHDSFYDNLYIYQRISMFVKYPIIIWDVSVKKSIAFPLLSLRVHVTPFVLEAYRCSCLILIGYSSYCTFHLQCSVSMFILLERYLGQNCVSARENGIFPTAKWCKYWFVSLIQYAQIFLQTETICSSLLLCTLLYMRSNTYHVLLSMHAFNNSTLSRSKGCQQQTK